MYLRWYVTAQLYTVKGNFTACTINKSLNSGFLHPPSIFTLLTTCEIEVLDFNTNVSSAEKYKRHYTPAV
jgi:hypothetical protein